jgi:hypothetical protein
MREVQNELKTFRHAVTRRQQGMSHIDFTKANGIVEPCADGSPCGAPKLHMTVCTRSCELFGKRALKRVQNVQQTNSFGKAMWGLQQRIVYKKPMRI